VNRTYLQSILAVAALLLACCLFGLFTTSEHVSVLGLSYLDQGNQILRHQNMLSGTAGNPWQYRILPDYLVQGVIRAFEHFGVPRPIAMAFFFFRVLQDSAVFFVSFLYYRKLGLSWAHALMGLSLLAWGMSYAHYGIDLQFSTYFDVLFYLLAGLTILHQKYLWIVPITLLAALNRETSGLIPFMLLFSLPLSSYQEQRPSKHPLWVPFCASLALYLFIFRALRLHYGHQEFITAFGHLPGLDLLHYNLFRLITWDRLFATLGVIPILALVGYSKWPPVLKRFFWVVVPAWFLIHAFCAIMAESRVFLVPQALVLIPGALFLASRPSRFEETTPGS